MNLETENLPVVAKEILKGLKYINIATVTKDGQPWNTPVRAVYDESYNLFWSSWASAQHSQNIRDNKRVFITVYGSSQRKGNDNQECLYIKAHAKQLDDEDSVAYALNYFYGLGDRRHTPSDFMEGQAKRIYQAVPEQVWLNQVSGTEINESATTERIEIPLNKLIDNKERG